MSSLTPTVRHTEHRDLPDIARLWADGDVMRFVGFPEGLTLSDTDMQVWWERLSASPRARHFAIEDPELGYCGEAYYGADAAGDAAEVDIKLFAAARGRGLGALGLTVALKELFERELARVARVDPHRDNHAAIALYRRLDFTEVEPWVADPESTHLYFEITASALT